MPRKKQEQEAQNWSEAPVSDVPLPEGWLWVRLADIASIEMGNSPPSSSYNTAGRGMPLINGPTEFGPGPLDNPTAIQFTDSPSKFCEPGNLLICVRGSTTGRTNVASFRASIGRGVAAIRAGECQPYVNHFVASQADLLLSIATGSTFPSITLAQLGALAVPFPPLAEQVRIVEAIEKSLAEINLGVAALARARDDLVRLRAAVLQAAVTGELTHSLAASSGGGENGSQLLARILSERRQRAEATSVRRKGGQTTLFGSSSGQYVEPAGPDIDSLGPLPERWVWATFGQLCELQLGRAKTPSNRPNLYPTPYLRVANITEEGLDLSNVLEMDFPPREREIYRLHRGDLLVSESSGSPTQVGKPAIWKEELPICCFQNHLIRIRPILVPSEYILVLLQHCYFNDIYAALTAGSGINHLGIGRLAQVSVPLPPENEQRAIINEVEQQLDAIRASRAAIEGNLTHAQQLRESVLARAFRGELITPRPVLESALTLLTRLRTLRTEARTAPIPRETVKKPKRTKSSKRRLLLDVVQEHPNGITPENLLAEANYTIEEVDEFYAQLARVANEVVEEKPTGDNALGWPATARVLLRPKAG